MSKNWITDGMRHAITLAALTVCVGRKLASENSSNPKYPIFASNETMRPNCGRIRENGLPLAPSEGKPVWARLDYDLLGQSPIDEAEPFSTKAAVESRDRASD
jgi:hypothetical protein